jgi:hypothetical protein
MQTMHRAGQEVKRKTSGAAPVAHTIRQPLLRVRMPRPISPLPPPPEKAASRTIRQPPSHLGTAPHRKGAPTSNGAAQLAMVRAVPAARTRTSAGPQTPIALLPPVGPATVLRPTKPPKVAPTPPCSAGDPSTMLRAALAGRRRIDAAALATSRSSQLGLQLTAVTRPKDMAVAATHTAALNKGPQLHRASPAHPCSAAALWTTQPGALEARRRTNAATRETIPCYVAVAIAAAAAAAKLRPMLLREAFWQE